MNNHHKNVVSLRIFQNPIGAVSRKLIQKTNQINVSIDGVFEAKEMFKMMLRVVIDYSKNESCKYILFQVPTHSHIHLHT